MHPFVKQYPDTNRNMSGADRSLNAILSEILVFRHYSNSIFNCRPVPDLVLQNAIRRVSDSSWSAGINLIFFALLDALLTPSRMLLVSIKLAKFSLHIFFHKLYIWLFHLRWLSGRTVWATRILILTDKWRVSQDLVRLRLV